MLQICLKGLLLGSSESVSLDIHVSNLYFQVLPTQKQWQILDVSPGCRRQHLPHGELLLLQCLQCPPQQHGAGPQDLQHPRRHLQRHARYQRYTWDAPRITEMSHVSHVIWNVAVRWCLNFLDRVVWANTQGAFTVAINYEGKWTFLTWQSDHLLHVDLCNW